MVRATRIVTGLILFAFVTGHLLNQSLGMVSLDKMDAWRGFFMAPWSNPVGSLLLPASFIVHILLAFLSLYRRNTLQMSSSDMVQFVSGFVIVPILASHVVAIKLAVELIPGYQPSYSGIVKYFWVQNPLEGLRQVLVIVVVWIHGAIGLLTWFKLQPWWAASGKFINPLIVIIPVAALLGFVEAGKEVVASAAGTAIVSSPADPEILKVLSTISAAKWNLIYGYFALMAIVLAARYFRLRGKDTQTTVNYLHGPRISIPTGLSLLELSIANDVPHANLCRGRGRCGTCQVRIVSAQNEISPPLELEQATLDRINASPDIRLACQLVPPNGEITVERVIEPYLSPAEMKKARNNSVQTFPNVPISDAGETEPVT